MMLDQTGHQQCFPRVAQGEHDGAGKISITQEIGHNGRHHCPSHDPPSCRRPKSDQCPGGNAGGRPKHSHALRSKEGKAHLCRQDIDAADHDSEPQRAQPLSQRVSHFRCSRLHSQTYDIENKKSGLCHLLPLRFLPLDRCSGPVMGLRRRPRSQSAVSPATT
jgi:hypothetical protein